MGLLKKTKKKKPLKTVARTGAAGEQSPYRPQQIDKFPPCIKACPTGALHRKAADGPVLLDLDNCIGCKYCLIACPFGAVVPTYDGRKVVKCDLCMGRLEAGQQPACVAGCPMDAIKFVEADEYVKEKRADAAKSCVDSSDQG